MRVGIDVGGTFTDLYAWDEKGLASNKVRMAKVLSTPSDPVIGVMNALSKAEIHPSEIDTIIHGTTIGTNALIERAYPEPIVVSTEGFRDVIEIRGQRRERILDPYGSKPTPLVSRKNRLTVSEKLGSDGEVVKILDREGARKIAEKIAQLDIKNIAITFINSYVNGVHEQEMRDIILQVIPEAQIALSSETSPKVRELGRFTTTVIRAALFPVIGDYITRLEKTLKDAGCVAPLFIVKSNGGMTRSTTAKEHPEELIRSGPAGGVTAGAFIYNLIGEENMIITDVGGTSFEASLVENGKGLVTDQYELEWGMPVTTPMLDIRSIGAGGGSIAWIDHGGSLRVGPKSAGADPGPACYGKGGIQPTVTDANLVLGRLNPTLSGKFQLDYEAALHAITTVAEPLGLSTIECAEGIIEIACESMAGAIRMVSSDRGRDPRDMTYVSFGGAGGLHAYRVAQSVGINRVLVPSFVGVDCATGDVVMDIRHDVEQTFFKSIEEIDTKDLTSVFDNVEKECRQLLENDGIPSEKMSFERTALMRCVGQSYEVATPIPNGSIDEETLTEIALTFNKEHEREYGVSNEDFPIAFVTLRVTGYGKTKKPEGDDLKIASGSDVQNGTSSIKEQREVYFNGEKHNVDVHNAALLDDEQEINGPAIIEHSNSEIVIPPKALAFVDEIGFIRITIDKTISSQIKEVII